MTDRTANFTANETDRQFAFESKRLDGDDNKHRSLSAYAKNLLLPPLRNVLLLLIKESQRRGIA
jgi:hypothetical protein